MAEGRIQRRLAAILAADVEGYSRLMRADEEATLETLAEYREVIDGLIARHDGRVFSTGGDSVLAEFGSVVVAVRCAISFQEEITTRNTELPDDRRLRFRIGINVGDVMVKGDDLFGDGINVAARLEGLAEPGGICISGSVFEQIKHKLSLGFEDLGPQEVKNISEPVSVFRVVPGSVSIAAGGKTASKPVVVVGRWRTPAIVAAVVAIMAVGAVILWQTDRPPTPPSQAETETDTASPIPDKRSIAVLPFANMSGDPEQEHFSDGITEDIITDLSKIAGLFVTARNSSFKYKGKAVDVQQVGRELGVRYVLEGSVRKAGDRVRITAQLIDTTTGNHLWAERYDRSLRDIFSVQDEVTGKIASALALTLKAGRQERPPPSRHTPKREAYDLFLSAKRIAPAEKEHVLDARRMFKRAIELDPEFGGGYAGLSWTHSLAVQHGFSDSPREDVNKALELARKALALDDTFGWSHQALATAYLVNGRQDDAVAAAEKSARLRPNDADAQAGLALSLMWAGRAEEAVAPIKRALRLKPRVAFSSGPYLNYSGFIYITVGRYEKAIAAFEENAKRGGATGIEVLAYSAAAYNALGREKEARAAAQELLRKFPDFSLRSWPWLRQYKNLEDWKRLLAVFRNAGLPEYGLGQGSDAKTYAYVFNEGSGDISIIDTEIQEVTATVEAGLRIRWFSNRFFDGKRVWTIDADFENAEVIVFDPWTLQTLKRIPFGKGPSMSLELSPDLKFAITISPGTDEVVVIDTATYEIVRRIPVGKFPCDLTLSLDGKLAYEVDRDQDTLTVLDWRSGKILKTVDFEKGSRPHMLTLSPDGRQLWVQERDSSKLSILDAKTLKRLARFSVGRAPITTEFAPNARNTLTTHIGESFLKVFDSSALSEITTIQVGRSPVNSIFDSSGRYAYVTNRQSNTVSVVDAARLEVVKTIKVGTNPFGIYLFNPSQGKMTGNR